MSTGVTSLYTRSRGFPYELGAELDGDPSRQGDGLRSTVPHPRVHVAYDTVRACLLNPGSRRRAHIWVKGEVSQHLTRGRSTSTVSQ
ncbi:hypothetical protein R1flu_018723 [Riccia fluitans]|uniref:Uncharacterized protein n=1 Tax=Riccia fluitans TaxID=41844 RepID=A0ABD1ZGN4_9MARC